MDVIQRTYETEVLRHWVGQSDGAHDLWHLRRVWTNAQRIMQELGKGDPEVLMAGAFLHDLVNPPKDSPHRSAAAALSAQAAVAFLAKGGMGSKQCKNVAHAIETHSFSAGLTPRTIEAKILQDADRLDALGALGIARCFNVSGQMGAALFEGADPLALDRPLDDRAYALDHFEVKLFAIADTMNTAPAQKIAAKRVAYMREFRAELLAETYGG